MKEILTHLFEQKTLNRKDAENVLTEIAGGKFSEAEIASFLTVFLMRTITPEELSGFFNRAVMGLHSFLSQGKFSNEDTTEDKMLERCSVKNHMNVLHFSAKFISITDIAQIKMGMAMLLECLF